MYIKKIFNLKKRKYNKIVVCMFLCLLIMVASFMWSYNEACAIAPVVIGGVAIAPEVIMGGIALFCAVGVTFSSSPEAQQAFTDFYAKADDTVKSACNSLHEGINNVADSLYDSIVGFVDSNYVDGTNTKTGTGTILPDGTYTNSKIGTFENPYIYGSSRCWIENDAVRIIDCDGISVIAQGTTGKNIDELVFYNTYSDGMFQSVNLDAKSNGEHVTWVNYPISRISSVSYNENPFASQVPLTYQYTKTSQTDWLKDGVRLINIPLVNTNVSSLTRESIITVPENTLTYPGTWTGTFSSCHPEVAAKQWTFSNPAITINTVGTWTGTWSELSTGEKQFTGTIEGINILVSPKTSPTPNPEPEKPRKEITMLPRTWVGDFEDSDPAEKASPSPNSVPYTFTPTETETQTGTWIGDWRETADGQRQFTGELVKPDGTTIPVTVTGGPVNTDPDLTDETKDWNIPDMFLLLLNVILATIRMVGRAIVFVGSLYYLPASSADIPENTKKGLDFLKDYQIPVINQSFWTIFMAVITFMYCMFMFKLIRKWVTRT